MRELFGEGEVVRIKDSFTCRYGTTPSMRTLSGHEVTIKHFDGVDGYRIYEDGDQYWWSSSCFDRIQPEEEDPVSLEGLL